MSDRASYLEQNDYKKSKLHTTVLNKYIWAFKSMAGSHCLLFSLIHESDSTLSQFHQTFLRTHPGEEREFARTF